MTSPWSRKTGMPTMGTYRIIDQSEKTPWGLEDNIPIRENTLGSNRIIDFY
jgi:hypothetical protein